MTWNNLYLDTLETYQGAFYTKKYRNVFAELGISEEAIDKRVQNMWDDLFYGDDETRIYYAVGDDEAYIYDTGSRDVRSEGMSYGMMMCVQMDKQVEFDRLWKWAKVHMQLKEGNKKGYFCWSMHTDGTSNSNGPAPDGEEYFALALFFASNRWGDKEEPYNYKEQARYILRQALHQGDKSEDYNMWNLQNHLIKFVPSEEFSDPSYHLPHFYELFALWADERDQEFWREAAKSSREYLRLACHKETGLAPEYATYNGEPVAYRAAHHLFAPDSYRVAGNIALDYLWFAKDQWQIEQSKRLQDFFAKEGMDTYSSLYTVDGIAQKEGNYQSAGLIGMNAMASLAATGDVAKKMVMKFWETPYLKGQWRYYDNCLYFFSLLALSGKYRIWEA